MAFPEAFLEELIARNDILDVVSSYVHLTKKGGNYFGLCPFHNEKTPSFSVSTDKQIYHCFGCKKGGGVINFIMEEEGLSFPEAVRFLAKRAGMEVPEEADGDREAARRRQRLLELNRSAAQFYYKTLHAPEGREALEYLNMRKIHRKTAMDFGLGAAPNQWDALITAMVKQGYTKTELLTAGLAVKSSNGRIYDKFRHRLIFPVIDTRGDVVAFGGRVLDKSEPKPVYSKRKVLYGLNLAKKTKRPNIILCEGNIDVITLHQAGFDNAAASMGTALTTDQIRQLSRFTKELVLCYDNDSAGQAATQKAIDLLNNTEFAVKVLQLPRRLVDGEYVKQDVDDFIKYQGKEAFEAILSGSGNQIEYRMNAIAAKYDWKDPAQQVEYAKEISELLCRLQSPVEREVYAGRAAETAGISREAMELEVKRARQRLAGKERAIERRESLNPKAQLQPKDRAMRYTDVRSAMAEEGVLRLLMRDDALFDHLDALSPEEFSSPLLGKIFFLLLQLHQQGLQGNINLLSGSLSSEEVSHLSGILQKPESVSNSRQALADYIAVIRQAWAARQGTADPLLAAQEKNKKKMGYGGKQI